jgi:hypothetical protein
LEYVDWGSQSIVQSKFQRTASRYGKDFQEDISISLRQYFFRKTFGIITEKERSAFFPSDCRASRSEAIQPKGLRKMQTAFSLSRPFLVLFLMLLEVSTE